MGERAMRIERMFRASRNRVFAAWTDPEVMRLWWAPGPDWTTRAEVDLRVGGQLSVTMTAPDGTDHAFSGTFLQIDPPRRLVYTSAWKGDAGAPSIVTVTFEDDGPNTIVVLEFTAPDDAAAGLESGWDACFINLERHFSRSST